MGSWWRNWKEAFPIQDLVNNIVCLRIVFHWLLLFYRLSNNKQKTCVLPWVVNPTFRTRESICASRTNTRPQHSLCGVHGLRSWDVVRRYSYANCSSVKWGAFFCNTVVINEQRVTITDYAKTAVQLLTYLTNHIKPKSAVFPYIVIMRLKLIGGSEWFWNTCTNSPF